MHASRYLVRFCGVYYVTKGYRLSRYDPTLAVVKKPDEGFDGMLHGEWAVLDVASGILLICGRTKKSVKSKWDREYLHNVNRLRNLRSLPSYRNKVMDTLSEVTRIRESGKEIRYV